METAPPPPRPVVKRRFVHTALFVLVLLPTLVAIAPRLPLDGYAAVLLQACGALAIVAGISLRCYCSLFIGGLKNRAVVNVGPYSVVRNPLYLGTFLCVIGLGMQSGTVALPLALWVILSAFYAYIVRGEEAFLRQSFPGEYDAYAQATPRWCPRLSQWTAPEVVEVRHTLVLSTFRDCLPFLASLPAMEILNLLKLHHVLPALLPLY
jgi:protein-S-isoprenylcysteine O-methyltransferase Ste14